jgi:hypothetical protein
VQTIVGKMTLRRHRHYLDDNVMTFFLILLHVERPPLWSSGQSSCTQIQRSRVGFPALPNFLTSSGSGMGSNQPSEYN